MCDEKKQLRVRKQKGKLGLPAKEKLGETKFVGNTKGKGKKLKKMKKGYGRSY